MSAEATGGSTIQIVAFVRDHPMTILGTIVIRHDGPRERDGSVDVVVGNGTAFAGSRVVAEGTVVHDERATVAAAHIDGTTITGSGRVAADGAVAHGDIGGVFRDATTDGGRVTADGAVAHVHTATAMVALGVDATTAVAADGTVTHTHRPVADVEDATTVNAGRVAANNAVAHAHLREAGTAVVVDATAAIG